MNSWKFFDQISVITIPAHHDRIKKLTTNFEKVHLLGKYLTFLMKTFLVIMLFQIMMIAKLLVQHLLKDQHLQTFGQARLRMTMVILKSLKLLVNFLILQLQLVIVVMQMSLKEFGQPSFVSIK